MGTLHLVQLLSFEHNVEMFGYGFQLIHVRHHSSKFGIILDNSYIHGIPFMHKSVHVTMSYLFTISKYLACEIDLERERERSTVLTLLDYSGKALEENDRAIVELYEGGEEGEKKV